MPKAKLVGDQHDRAVLAGSAAQNPASGGPSSVPRHSPARASGSRPAAPLPVRPGQRAARSTVPRPSASPPAHVAVPGDAFFHLIVAGGRGGDIDARMAN